MPVISTAPRSNGTVLIEKFDTACKLSVAIRLIGNESVAASNQKTRSCWAVMDSADAPTWAATTLGSMATSFIISSGDTRIPTGTSASSNALSCALRRLRGFTGLLGALLRDRGAQPFG